MTVSSMPYYFSLAFLFFRGSLGSTSWLPAHRSRCRLCQPRHRPGQLQNIRTLRPRQRSLKGIQNFRGNNKWPSTEAHEPDFNQRLDGQRNQSRPRRVISIVVLRRQIPPPQMIPIICVQLNSNPLQFFSLEQPFAWIAHNTSFTALPEPVRRAAEIEHVAYLNRTVPLELRE